MNAFNKVVHLEDVSVIARDQIILKEIHMVINTGEFCYLQGDTGSGKSSFLQGIYGLMEMTGAKMRVVGFDYLELTSQTLPEYRRKIGFISGSYPLFTDQSVFKNLDRILALMDWAIASEREKRVNEVLDQLGLNTYQGEQLSDLPSGLRQKVAIARSVLNKPSLILADNPMVYLDNKSTEDIMNLFIDLVKNNKTSILCSVSDDSLPSKYPARSYLCADGTITESK